MDFQSSQMQAPYAPTTAALGGLPTNGLDTIVCAVFLVLFACAAACNMTILQINLRRGHKFLMSGMAFGFCMARITSCVMRIVWANYPFSVKIAIAAQVFVAAGVVLLFIINLIFAQRLVRALHPNIGWHRLFHWAFIALYVLIVLTLATIIVAVIQSFYTLDPNIRRIDRDLQLYGQSFYVMVSFLPILLIAVSLAIPRQSRPDKFGEGRMRTKFAVCVTSAVLLCLGASFRNGTNYLTPRPRQDPAWYQSKACFYIFNFTIEIIVLCLWILSRVDRRFHVPNGSKGPGDYGAGKNTVRPDTEEGLTRSKTSDENLAGRTMTEDTMVDAMPLESLQHREEYSHTGLDATKDL
ncbi:hypothetical protein MMC25_000848 [Agyrium rufum]|nr:hypothetical protein [Agyrium rufum]